MNVLDALVVVWKNDESTDFRKSYLSLTKMFLKNQAELILSKAELEDLPARRASELRTIEQKASRDEQDLKGAVEYFGNIVLNKTEEWVPQNMNSLKVPAPLEESKV
jgi:hypothetical protein